MTQLFSNAVDTTLATPITGSDTSATLTDGSGLKTPTGGAFELLVLTGSGSTEIVKVSARSGNTVTIVRAQEGTTAASWGAGTRVFAGVTAGTLASFLANQTTLTGSLLTGLAATTDGTNSVTLGPSAEGRIDGVAIGRLTRLRAEDCTAVGRAAFVDGPGGTAMGAYSGAWGVNDVAIGALASAFDGGSLALGEAANAAGARSTAIGSVASASGANSMALGPDASASRAHVLVQSVLPAVTRLPSAAATAAWDNVATPAVITSGALNLKNAQVYEIPMPSGVTFFPDEVGIIVTAASSVTGQPVVQWGVSGGVDQYIDSGATTGLTAVSARQRFQTLKTAQGATTLRFEVVTGATGTTLTGRIYWRGIAFENL